MIKVLLISSDTLFCQLLEQALRKQGYELVITDREDKGLALAFTESPDLILYDADTLGINSLQAVKLIRASKVLQQIPTIAIVDRTVSDGHLLHQAGFDTYVRKPISLSSLLLRFEILLDTGPGARTKPDRTQPKSPSARVNSPPAKATPCQNPAIPPKVVYVNNCSTDNATMAQIIQQLGYGYDGISNPIRALSQLITIEPQLVFLESIMSVTNGYELCAQLRRTPTYKKTPIIIVTNTNEIGDRMRARIVRASGFLKKPIDLPRTRKVIMKYLPTQN